MPPGLLAKATQVARQYRTEHGTPITAGQLAIRLKVNSEQAAQLLGVLDLGSQLGTDSPTVWGFFTSQRRLTSGFVFG